jgi:small ligand-binding sensory domain FIST
MSPAFRHAHAAARRWQDAARACADGIASAPRGANLGFLYFSDHYAAHAAELLEYMKEETGVDDWVGTVGVGVIATATEYLDEPAMSVMLGAFPPESYRVFSGRQRPPRAGTRTASGSIAGNFAVVHGDPHTPDIPELIDDMSRKVESGFLVGGLSSSRTRTVQIANQVLEGGLSGVIFSSEVAIATRLTQGCAPLTRSDTHAPVRHRVTACERNVIAALDDRPALDVFREEIGEELARDLGRAARVVLVGLSVPGSDTGDYLARNVVGIDPRNKLFAIGAPVEQGMSIMFCRRDGDAAREDLVRMLRALRAELRGVPRGGLYYSCIGRGAQMFGQKSAELEIIRAELGDFPMVGFFCNGEISHDRLYGYTGVLTLFV